MDLGRKERTGEGGWKEEGRGRSRSRRKRKLQVAIQGTKWEKSVCFALLCCFPLAWSCHIFACRLFKRWMESFKMSTALFLE